jgi:mannosyltransferase OCH1-like enzyme
MKTTPRRLFQVLITDESSQALETTHALERNIESLKSTYPKAEYQLYGDRELIDFLAENYPEPVLQAYRALTPYAFKADLARYCLLFTYGGLYSDLSYLHLRPIEIGPRREMVVFRDIPGHPSWAVSNAIIYAEARSPVMERAIGRVVEHFKARYYGYHSLEPTGPYMFGRILAETSDWTTIKFGDSSLLNIDRTGRPNIVKVMPTGEVIAIRNKTKNSQITDLVASGGNNYNTLWAERRIWGESGTRGVLGKLRSKLMAK